MLTLFAAQVALYSIVVFYIASLDNPLRRIAFYIYISLVLAFGGFLGSVFSMPMTETVKISAGSMAYGALMMTSILFVIIERDLFILRNIVRLVITVNLFKILLFLMLSIALEIEGIINPNNASAAIYDISFSFTILGGSLIIAELLLLFYAFEQMKKLTSNVFYLSASYLLLFIFVLCLDGVLFQTIAFGFSSELINIVFSGAQAKLIMASAYSIPMLLFLVLHRNKLTGYFEHPAFKWSLLLTSSDKLMRDMQAQDERLRQAAVVFENTREGIIVTDPELTIVNFNQAFSRLSGLDESQFVDRKPTLKSIQPIDEDFYSAMQKGLLQNDLWQGEVVIAEQSGGVQNQLLSINVVKDQAGDVINYVGVFTDITQRKRVEQEREHLIKELEDKNVRLERFVYTISHELKTPLVTIAGFTGILHRDYSEGKSENLDAHFTQIESAITDMSVLLDDLLKLAQLGYVDNKLEPVALTELAKKASEQLRFHPGQSNLAIDIADDMPRVLADRVRLLEVLQNLMENAIKFSAGTAQPKISIDAIIEAGEVICSVRDNGRGIEPEYHERVFKLFERLDQSVEGTGVGLPLVRGIVESHGGRIWVESEGLAKGSRFRFSLPLQDQGTNTPA